jgi:hypothetical protein
MSTCPDHRNECGGGRAGRNRPDIDTGLTDQRDGGKVGRGADRGKGHGLAGSIFEGVDRRGRRHVPEQVVGAGHGRGDRSNGRALCKRTQDRGRSGRNGNVGAAGNERLHGLAAAGCIERLDLETVFSKDAFALAEIRNRRLPIALLRDEHLDGVLRKARHRGSAHGKGHDNREHDKGLQAEAHIALQIASRSADYASFYTSTRSRMV